MLLFSSFNHFYILLMFLYLGLLSGFIFFIIYLITNKLKTINFNVDRTIFRKVSNKKQKNLSKIKKNLVLAQSNKNEDNLKNKTKNKKGKQKNNDKSKNKKSPNREILKKINNLTKNFLTFKSKFINQFKIIKNLLILFFNKFKNIILVIVNLVALCSVVLFSYYINYKYNMGYLRVIFVVIWLSAFIISSSLVKKVAKMFINFYNKLKQNKINRNNNLNKNERFS